MVAITKRVGVLVSGGGSNLQSLIDAVAAGEIQAEIVTVISDKPGVYALERAARHGIPAAVVDHRDYPSRDDFTRAILDRLLGEKVDLICLAGFMRILSSFLPETYPQRMLNIHPALLPAFGGKGMYGLRVHEAVLASGAKFSGATVHIVTSETDVGPIVCQEVVPVADDDTPETLARRVLEVEHRIYPRALKLLAEDLLEIDGLRTRIKKGGKQGDQD